MHAHARELAAAFQPHYIAASAGLYVCELGRACAMPGGLRYTGVSNHLLAPPVNSWLHMLDLHTRQLQPTAAHAHSA